MRPKALAIGPQIQDTFARAYKAGVNIAFGTDSGVSPHGDNWREFVYMVEAGMPAMAAIQSATIVAADLSGTTETLGSLEPGKFWRMSLQLLVIRYRTLLPWVRWAS